MEGLMLHGSVTECDNAQPWLHGLQLWELDPKQKRDQQGVHTRLMHRPATGNRRGAYQTGNQPGSRCYQRWAGAPSPGGGRNLLMKWDFEPLTSSFADFPSSSRCKRLLRTSKQTRDSQAGLSVLCRGRNRREKALYWLVLDVEGNRIPQAGPAQMDPNTLSMEQGKEFLKQCGIPQRDGNRVPQAGPAQMDPNTLSMEQGKEFLKQCGIPQRDIDLMTEKWVVLASVEVLLRFPLKSGEDPTARCVSNKRCQPSVDRPSTVSQRCGYREERKPNSQLMKKTDQKLKDLPQTASDSICHQAQRPPTAKNPQKQQRKPVGPRAPPADEEESRVKCKNCGAFGHSARNTTCPMKRWSGALPLQPLGSHKEKENLKTAKPQLPQAPGSFLRDDREKEPGSRPQQQKQSKAPTQTLPRTPQEKVQGRWEEPEEDCWYLRHPTMPLPVHITKKRSVQGPGPTGPPPPIKTPGTRLLCPSGHNKQPELSSCGPTQGHGGDITAFQLPALKSSHQVSGLSARPPANRPEASSHSALQPAMKAFALGPGLKSQAEIRPDANAKPRSQQVRKKCGQETRTQAAGKKRVQVPIQTSQNPTKKARLSSFPTPALRTQLPDVGAVQPLQLPSMATGLGPKQVPKATTKTAATKTATGHPRVNLQSPEASSPFLGPAQGCPVLQPEPPIPVPGRPGSVTFMRGGQGQEKSRFRTPPTSCPPEDWTSGQSLHFSRESEGQGPQVSRSVLYEDLRVTSSSEDSDSD
ncbi:protein FAM90A27P-like [Cebus imitator]|uniref:protein FAM90A27P-like n=1 Tax=Cebus imitator TaxID=2715852 RepID=UPI00189ACF44|nr:protein FAM90A27P-like [Cebus imitator]